MKKDLSILEKELINIFQDDDFLNKMCEATFNLKGLNDLLSNNTEIDLTNEYLTSFVMESILLLLLIEKENITDKNKIETITTLKETLRKKILNKITELNNKYNKEKNIIYN